MDDLGRAGRGSGRRCRPCRGHSGRAGIPPGSWSSFADPEGVLQDWGSFAGRAALLRGPGVLLLIRDGVLQDWERILSFFAILGLIIYECK